MSTEEGLITAEEMSAGIAAVRASPLRVRRTPMLLAADGLAEDGQELVMTDAIPRSMPGIRLFLKMESAQRTGSFKLRGIANQFDKRMKEASSNGTASKPHFVTMSAGNYGRSFAFAARALGARGTVLMPETAPDSRAEDIQDMGCDVERWPTAKLMEGVRKHESEHGSVFLHSFDDRHLLGGYASLGEEILEEADPEVVLVCCGGGGVVSGVAAYLKMRKGDGVKVYAVEPEQADCMHRSVKEGRVASTPHARSVASGLSPPFAGALCYAHVAKHCAGVLLVSEAQLRAATKMCYDRGMKAEPAGVAAVAAVVFGQLESAEGASLEGKTVVAVVTGGNATPEELADVFKQAEQDNIAIDSHS